MKYTTLVFRSLLLLISLMVLTDVASAQRSLIFSDTEGRRVEFTIFGTIVYPDKNIVSRGYEVVYGNNLRAWYLNSSFNSGIVPVSLSSDQSDEKPLNKGTRVYVRAVVRTEDGRLTITHRYIWRVGTPRIDAVVTVKNSSGYPLRLSEVSILTPYTRSAQGKSSTPATPSTPVTPSFYSCHCSPAVPYDGSEVDSETVEIPPDMTYVKTTASYPSPDLQEDGSVDVPGCDHIPGESPTASVC
jgi:hypothetical protein